MFLAEKVGEFAKATRKFSGMKTAEEFKIHDLHEKAADILWLSIDLSNRLGVDLEKAFRDKEAKNQTRIWK